jgi:hypothetical protein
MVVLPDEGLDSIGSAIDWCVWDSFHQGRQRAAVIHLPVVDHNQVDILQADFAFQILEEFFGMGQPDRINQDCFFLLDEIRILAGTMINGLIVAMKGFQFPVNFADPVCIVFDQLFHSFPPLPVRWRH